MQMLTFPSREQKFTLCRLQQPSIFDMVGDIEGHRIASCERDALSCVPFGCNAAIRLPGAGSDFPVNPAFLVPRNVNTTTTGCSSSPASGKSVKLYYWRQ